jgi:hypothetical protein
MWLLFGARTKAKRVPGGREVERACPECKTVTRWAECDVKDRYHVFFVSLGSTTVRRLVCTRCGEDASLEEAGLAPTTAAPAPTLGAATPPRRPATEKETDQMLRELKKKMRREGKL